MRILDETVERYIHGLRPERSPVMAEMEAVADRDGVPIVHWETGRFLAVLCRALDPVVLEVGTAIGYSTLHMAEQLRDGRVITLELREDRAAQARDFFERGGVADRVELIDGRRAGDDRVRRAVRSTCSSSTPPRTSTSATSSWPSRSCPSGRCWSSTTC